MDRIVAVGQTCATQASILRQIEKNSTCSSLVNSDGTASGPMQADAVTKFASEGEKTTSFLSSSIQKSSLLDLNSSNSPVVMHCQSFTILQQMQLRAQIFVYGSIIQGTAPDEACMISAFRDGCQDGGRSTWEKVWRVAVKRLKNQKLQVNSLETSSCHDSARVSMNTSLNIPVSSSESKGAGSAITNPSLSSPSPARNISTPSDSFPANSMSRSALHDSRQISFPLHSFPTLPVKSFVGNATLWQSQMNRPVSGVVYPHSSLDAGRHCSALPIAEAIKVTSVRVSSEPSFTVVRDVSPITLAPSVVPADFPINTDPAVELKRSMTRESSFAEQKSRKGKKNAVTELSQTFSDTQSPNESASSTRANKQSSLSEGILSAPPKFGTTSGSLPSSCSPVLPSMHYQIVGSGNTDHRVIFSEETCDRVHQAKLHAQEAAALADSAVKHSQYLWNQLAVKKNSGLISEVETKLASAAVAAAAAVSVAKAATAAAKVASDAALQAKLIADEALVIPKLGNSTKEACFDLHGKNFEESSAVSITKGEETKGLSSFRIFEHESARRVEIAKSAAKRAENLDAVLKAAELAAEAISHAGKVIMMGDPIPFNMAELVEAGPEGYWKAQGTSVKDSVNANGLCVSEQLRTVPTVEYAANIVEQLKNPLSEKNESQRTTAIEGIISTVNDLVHDQMENHIEPAITLEEKFGGRERKKSPLAIMAEETTEAEARQGPPLMAQNDKDEINQLSGIPKKNDIKEGSRVEVVSDEDGLRGVWFSAKVLSLNDGKALVSYTNLLQDEGFGKLKEWVTLEAEGNKAPRIRKAHPMSAMKFEGTRKRHRAVFGSHVWSIGDCVDAWMRDGWWEGIVTGRSSSDETKLTVHFPGGGDSSTVRAWNLRPSLVWKNGQWMEWSREKDCRIRQNGIPEGKCLKLDIEAGAVDLEVDPRGNNQLKVTCLEDSRESEESTPVLNKASNVMKGNTSQILTLKRTGLQKGGSRVVFGIPNPGEKRKFIKVDRNYTADAVAEISERTDSVKFAKYLVPQESIRWKNTSKVGYMGKRLSDSKDKMLNSGGHLSIPNRSVSEQNGSSVPTISASCGSTDQDTLHDEKAIGPNENSMDRSDLLEAQSLASILKAVEDPVLYSEQEHDLGVRSTDKASLFDDREGGRKAKVASARGNLSRDDVSSVVNGITVQDAFEPRRSSRRIRPTSRLLEGLQSSLIISKIPSLSHGKDA